MPHEAGVCGSFHLIFRTYFSKLSVSLVLTESDPMNISPSKKTALLLLSALLFLLTGCGKKKTLGYEVLSKLDDEQFSVAFRSDDPLRDMVSAALEEVAAEGLLSRLSEQYLGNDYSCLSGTPGALETLGGSMPPNRPLRVGVQDGAAPLSWKDDSGNFTGMIPDLVNAVAAKLGCEVVYCEIRVEDVEVELGSGNVDCAWLPASFPASEDYSLSPAWMQNSHLLVVRQGSGLNRVKDLKNHNIGVTDSTSELALKNNSKIYDSVTIWTYADIRSCFTALSTGECDALIIDNIVSMNYLG